MLKDICTILSYQIFVVYHHAEATRPQRYLQIKSKFMSYPVPLTGKFLVDVIMLRCKDD